MAAPSPALNGAGILAGLEAYATLPGWLTDAVDPETVAAGLVAAVDELGSGELELTSVEAAQPHLKRQGWLGTYELAVEGPPGLRGTLELAATLVPPSAEPARCTGAFGSPEWRGSLPALGLRLRTRPPDAELPALAVLTDPARAASLLEAAIRAGSPAYADLRILGCTPRVARHKPGSRTTVVYDLEYPAEAAGRGWPPRVVAKTYKGGKGANAYAAMRALWASPLRSSEVVAIAEPLAYLEGDRILVQGPVAEEVTLKALLDSGLRRPSGATAEALTAAFRRAAAGLAALHGCGVGYGETVTFDDEHAEVSELADRIARQVPGVAGAADGLLALVAERAGGSAPSFGPCHRSFRPGQVLLAGESIAFIDFDGFCQGEPALDLALFRAAIKTVAADSLDQPVDATQLRDRFRQAEHYCEIFTSAYAEHAPVDPERVEIWEALDLLTSALHGWTRIDQTRLTGQLFALRAHVDRLLSRF
jgi:hypothetical protein